MRPYNRISLILLGAAVYWVGYTGFLTMQNVACSCLCMFLIVSGLWVAGTNSSNLFSGK
jgi:hypothetical protein